VVGCLLFAMQQPVRFSLLPNQMLAVLLPAIIVADCACAPFLSAAAIVFVATDLGH
jgi:hypothetical protein